MEKAEVTEFGGVTGQVVARAMGVTSMITGIVLGVLMLILSYAAARAGAPAAISILTQVVFTMAMARFALNGLYGEWTGTVFSGAGGSWVDVLFVSGRYLALTALWFIPMMIFGGMPQDNQEMAMMMMGGAGAMLGAMGFYLLAMTLTPPLFLIVSVSADSFGDLFSVDHWRALFSGRRRDLFAVYVVYVGGLAMMVVLFVPVVLLGFMGNAKLGMFTVGVGFCYLLGVSVTLMGRLCGFFACGDMGLSQPGDLDVARPASPPRVGPAPALGTRSPVSAAPVMAQPVVQQPVAPVAAPVAASIPLSGAAAPAVAQAVPPVAPLVAQDPTATVQLSPDMREQLVGTAVQAAPAAAEPAVAREQRPPLMDGQQRVESLMPRLAQEPNAVLSSLEDLHRTYAPHPQVMQALSIAKARCGQAQEAVPLAKQALAICFSRGHNLLCAQVFKEFRPYLEQLGLNRDQLILIGGALTKNGELSAAAKAYSAVINVDPGELRAVKGLLQVADEILQKKGKPEAALKVYRYLVSNCSGSPLVDYMRSGLEEAQRKLGEPSPG